MIKVKQVGDMEEAILVIHEKLMAAQTPHEKAYFTFQKEMLSPCVNTIRKCSKIMDDNEGLVLANLATWLAHMYAGVTLSHTMPGKAAEAMARASIEFQDIVMEAVTQYERFLEGSDDEPAAACEPAG